MDNAKRRLVNWIGRLMRKNALDATDLEGLFAAVARKTKRGNTKRPEPQPIRALN